ncbi:zinc ribbon domain-containing protein [Microbispora sp. NPDC088329]|uniref:helix-turn-helix domain-containing protein n=1 Tax=Microbispora sp. NPDC088329 TaxID=3154869 RepID=UPI003425FD92
MRTAYKVRVYPTPEQAAVLSRTFGCVRLVVVIDRGFHSSKTCSGCGHLLAALSLSTRHWTCPGCGTRHDRDVNAATNILAAGRAVSACGADVSPQGSSLRRSAVKQETHPVRGGTPRFRRGRKSIVQPTRTI